MSFPIPELTGEQIVDLLWSLPEPSYRLYKWKESEPSLIIEGAKIFRINDICFSITAELPL